MHTWLLSVENARIGSAFKTHKVQLDLPAKWHIKVGLEKDTLPELDGWLPYWVEALIFMKQDKVVFDQYLNKRLMHEVQSIVKHNGWGLLATPSHLAFSLLLEETDHANENRLWILQGWLDGQITVVGAYTCSTSLIQIHPDSDRHLLVDQELVDGIYHLIQQTRDQNRQKDAGHQ